MERVTAERLRAMLDYDAETGVFRWRVHRARSAKPGMVAGKPHRKGYTQIKVEGRLYYAHRLAWLHAFGSWPTGEVDHINGQKNDNRLANLRDATRAQNAWNLHRAPRSNTSTGVLGVTRLPSGRKPFLAQIMGRGRHHRIGRFATLDAASAAYRAAKAQRDAEAG